MKKPFTLVLYTPPIIPGWRCVGAGTPKGGDVYSVVGEETPTLRIAQTKTSYQCSAGCPHYFLWEKLPPSPTIIFKPTGEYRRATKGEYILRGNNVDCVSEHTFADYPIYIKIIATGELT